MGANSCSVGGDGYCFGKGALMIEFQKARVNAVVFASLFRRLGAMLSDALVVFGLLALTTLFVFVPILNLLGKKAMVPSEVGWSMYFFYLTTMLGVWLGFYGYFWVRNGQTIGMRAWRIKVVSLGGEVLTWGQSLRRWVLAVLPWFCASVALNVAERWQLGWLTIIGYGVCVLGVLGLLRMYIQPDKLTWHDRLSGSCIILLPEQ